MFRLKRTQLDALFSDYIRERDKWTCVRCGRKHEPYQRTLDCSHYFSRGHPKAAIRFDPENADALCKMPCHAGRMGWEHHKVIGNPLKGTGDGEYTIFKRSQLGSRRFDLLVIRAHTPTRVDEIAMTLFLEEELKRLRGEK